MTKRTWILGTWASRRSIAGVLLALSVVVGGSAFAFDPVSIDVENVSDDLKAIVSEIAPTTMVDILVGNGTPLTPAEQQRITALVTSLGGTVKATSFASFSGYAASVPANRLAELAEDGASLHIVPDRHVKPSMDVALPTIGETTDGSTSSGGALGNLVGRVLDGLAGTPAPAPVPTGKGVTVAVIDSGIAVNADLKTNLGLDRVIVRWSAFPSGTALDEFGHGTHVAGIVGGNAKSSSGQYAIRTFRGVAPDVRLVSLKVLGADGSGSVSNVLSAVDWILANKSTYGIRIVNLSLGHPVVETCAKDPLCQAVESMNSAGHAGRQRPAAAQIDLAHLTQRAHPCRVGGLQQAEHVVQHVAEHAPRAGHEALRVDQVLGALLVHHHGGEREHARDRPHAAGVVEMDVGHDDGREVVRSDPQAGEPVPNHVRGACGAGLYEAGACRAEEVGGRDPLVARHPRVDRVDVSTQRDRVDACRVVHWSLRAVSCPQVASRRCRHRDCPGIVERGSRTPDDEGETREVRLGQVERAEHETGPRLGAERRALAGHPYPFRGDLQHAQDRIDVGLLLIVADHAAECIQILRHEFHLELAAHILALTSITVTTAVTIDGRVLARNGAVTLDTDTITRSGCAAPAAPATTATTASREIRR
jgi:hypothetical protein